MANDPSGLAAALRGLGQGAMPYVGDRLDALRMPVLVVAGERDERYVEIARLMADRIPNGQVAVVPGAGHAVVAEAPERLAALVDGFLDPA
jgi:pimeloyl-ACP methyl ester carboxylesterase